MEIVEVLTTERAKALRIVNACDIALAAFTGPPPVAAVTPAPVEHVPIASVPGKHNRDEERAQAILASLKNGPLSTRDIALRINGERLVVKQALQRLGKAGEIRGLGHGNGRVWALPGAG